MQVEVTTNDENGQVVYEIPGYPVKVIVDPDAAMLDEDEVAVEVWDEAGCNIRETRPADQAQRIALKTLFDEYRADQVGNEIE